MEAILGNLGVEIAGHANSTPGVHRNVAGIAAPAQGVNPSRSGATEAVLGGLPGSPATPATGLVHAGPSGAADGIQRLLLDAVQDKEEGEEDAERRRSQARAAQAQVSMRDAAQETTAGVRSRRKRVAGTAAGPSYDTPAGAVEPAFEFAPIPTDVLLASNKDAFVSRFMLQVVANWPQTLATAKRRPLNGEGDDCPGALAGAEQGTNASLKTWSTRIRVACSFANFVGRAVCWHPDDPCPSDEERDRGVRKFFRCLSPFTKRVVVAYLNSRKKGIAVAGGGRRLSAVSQKDFTNGLSFMFGEAKMDGPNGDQDLVVDCADRTASWKAKGEAEHRAEKLVRDDPGSFIGNPMTTTDMKNWRSATQKQARLDGEQSKSAAAVTPEFMVSLHNELFSRHCDGTEESAPGATEQPATLLTQEESLAVYTAISDVDADQLNYTFYALAFISLARPATLLDMKFEDVTFPDLKLAENAEFFNRHKHHRFVNLALRVEKTANRTTDLLYIRFYSYYTEETAHDEELIGQTAWVHCNSEHLNFPQLFNGLVYFATSAPGVGVDVAKLNQQYLFPSVLKRSVSGSAALFKKRSETEVNSRFVADLERIGKAYINGERACRMYGFRRGGAQALLNETGLFEQVMRLGGWRPDSNSFFKYITAMNSRGTLRSTLRSYRKDEVTQVVAQVISTYNAWTAGVVRELCSRALGDNGRVDRDRIANIEADHVKRLCTVVCECILVLRAGSGATEAAVTAADDDSSSEDDA